MDQTHNKHKPLHIMPKNTSSVNLNTISRTDVAFNRTS